MQLPALPVLPALLPALLPLLLPALQLLLPLLLPALLQAGQELQLQALPVRPPWLQQSARPRRQLLQLLQLQLRMLLQWRRPPLQPQLPATP